MTRVGILVAMAPECRSLTRRRIPEGGCLRLDDGCVIGLAGAGPLAAHRMASKLVGEGVDSLLSWGCAAALSPDLKPGDLVLPKAIVGADGEYLETTTAWRESLSSRLPVPVYSGDMVESKRIVAKASEKKTLFEATGAIALDMESAAAARAAKAAGLPFLAIRSIVDPADVDIPPSILAAFDENGMLHVPRMLGRAMLHPLDFLHIIRLGKQFGAAMKTLRQIAPIARQTPAAP